MDDPERVAFYSTVLAEPKPPTLAVHDERHQRLLTMLAWGLGSGGGPHGSVDGFLRALWKEAAVKRELTQLLGVLDARSSVVGVPSSLAPEIPLAMHARYSRWEIVAALGGGDGPKPKVTQSGILFAAEANADAFFIDLHKSARDYSPTTMYRDYAISPELFHWESQSRQHDGQPTVKRYINHAARGSSVLLFVRERKSYELGTMPFTFLGPATYVDHRGSRPVAFTWKLPVPMPQELFQAAQSVAAA